MKPIIEAISNLSGREALEALSKYLREVKPEDYNQEYVHSRRYRLPVKVDPYYDFEIAVREDNVHNCDTIGCAWGYGMALFAGARATSAMRFFGLTGPQEEFIFGAKPASGTPQEAADRIDHVLAGQSVRSYRRRK